MILEHTGATPVEDVTKHALGVDVTLVSSTAKPSHSLHGILRHALPMLVQEAEGKLCLRVALISGESIPLCRLRVVTWYAPASSVHRSELVLGRREPLFGLKPA